MKQSALAILTMLGAAVAPAAGCLGNSRLGPPGAGGFGGGGDPDGGDPGGGGNGNPNPGGGGDGNPNPGGGGNGVPNPGGGGFGFPNPGSGGNGGQIPGCGAGGRSVILPARTLSFFDPVEYDTGAGAYAAVLGDLNGDGRPDLVVRDAFVGLRTLLNNGNGSFGSPIDHPTGMDVSQMAVGDLNGDGRADIAVVVPNGISLLMNLDGSAFAPPITYAVGDGASALTLADLNGDGRLDIAVANRGYWTGLPNDSSNGDVAVLLNTGAGTFSATSYPASPHPSSIAAADFNGDCRPDLVTGDDGNFGGRGGISVLLNRGNGSFPAPSTFGAGTRPTSIAVGDLNGDGRIDLATSGPNSNDTYVLLNYGNGSFTAAVIYSVRDPSNTSALTNSSGVAQVTIGDLNGDGIGDLAVASTCCGLAVLLNRGDGSLSPPSNYPVLDYATSIALGDLDGDGKGDLVVVSQNQGLLPVGSALSVRRNASR